MRKNKGYIMSKKGQISDMVFVLLTLASIAITLVIAGYVYTQINTGLDDSGLQSNESAEAYDNFSVAFNFFDAGFGFILAGFIIGLIISAFQIPSHPIFIAINLFGFLVLVFLGAVFSNLYGEIIVQEGVNNSAGIIPITTYFMSILPWIGAIIVFIVSVVMFSKGRANG